MSTLQKRSRRRSLNGRHGRKTTNRHDFGFTPNQFVVRNNRTTHVVLPINEYDRLMQQIESAELAAIIENPKTKWTDADDFISGVVTEKLVDARKKAGLTQGQLAAKLKMPQSQISRIERNPDRTTVRTLKKIAKALGVDVARLI